MAVTVSVTPNDIILETARSTTLTAHTQGRTKLA